MLETTIALVRTLNPLLSLQVTFASRSAPFKVTSQRKNLESGDEMGLGRYRRTLSFYSSLAQSLKQNRKKLQEALRQSNLGD